MLSYSHHCRCCHTCTCAVLSTSPQCRKPSLDQDIRRVTQRSLIEAQQNLLICTLLPWQHYAAYFACYLLSRHVSDVHLSRLPLPYISLPHSRDISHLGRSCDAFSPSEVFGESAWKRLARQALPRREAGWWRRRSGQRATFASVLRYCHSRW